MCSMSRKRWYTKSRKGEEIKFFLLSRVEITEKVSVWWTPPLNNITLLQLSGELQTEQCSILKCPISCTRISIATNTPTVTIGSPRKTQQRSGYLAWWWLWWQVIGIMRGWWCNGATESGHAPEIRTLNSEALWVAHSRAVKESTLSTSPLLCFFHIETLVGSNLPRDPGGINMQSQVKH